jgi:hypothetical protein
MNEFGRIREFKEIDETKRAKERKPKTCIDDDILYTIKTMSLAQLQASNEERRQRENNQ